MKGVLRIIRDNEIKLSLPGPSITIKTDGTLWYQGIPILGIADPKTKAEAAKNVKLKRYDLIPADAWVRLGNNPNGIWAGDDVAWNTHPTKIVQDKKEADKKEQESRQARIYLSSRGWGDYSACEWSGDITRPDADILGECRKELGRKDVDRATQTDEEILTLIRKARQSWKGRPAREAAVAAREKADLERKIATGYCFACESYCYGDCGNYSKNPMTKFRRDLSEARREEYCED